MDNIVIAKFMNNIPLDKSDMEYYMRINYHISWGLLMPVVERIESMGYGIEICQCDVTIYEHSSKGTLNHLFSTNSKSKIQSTWSAVLAFINWHNQQPK